MEQKIGNFLTNSPKGNEKPEVFQQIHLQEKAELKRGRVKEEQKIGSFLTNSPKRGRVKELNIRLKNK